MPFKNYLLPVCIVLVAINLAFTAWLWTDTQQQLTSLRNQPASSSTALPAGFGVGGEPVNQGTSPVEKGLATPPAPMSAGAGSPPGNSIPPWIAPTETLQQEAPAAAAKKK